MVIASSDLYGIDKQIKLVQDYLEMSLAEVWAGSIRIYGRAIETERNGAKHLEFWDSKKDYLEMFINDKGSAVIGFKVNTREVNNNRLKAIVDIIFTINITECLVTPNYLDEKAMMQAYKIVQNCGYVEGVTGLKVGIDEVFSGYETENIKHRDMAPFHIFSFTTQIEYFEATC